MKTGDPLLAKKISSSPWGQALSVFILILIGIGIAHMIPNKPTTDWTVTATGLLLFAAANPILGIFQRRWPRYVLFSIVSFAMILPATLFLTQATAGSSLSDLTHFKMFFVAAGVFFFLSTGLVGIYRFIIRLLQDAE